LVVLAVAIVAGLTAVVLANRWMAQERADNAGFRVVVAAKNIDLGTRLTEEMLKAVPWPKESVPEGAFDAVEKVITRVAKTTVQSGEPLMESKLAPVGTTGGLASVITEGKRAMTVQVNEIIGVAGFALPGNYVDILVNTDAEKTGKSSGRDARMVSKIVLERVLVLAIAQEASRDETKPKVVSAVTLEVSPEEAERIDLARSVGTLTLVLRNQVDTHLAGTTGAGKQELLKEVEGVTPPKPQMITRVVVKHVPTPVKAADRAVEAAKHTEPEPTFEKIEVIRGTARSTEQVKVMQD
jgi:pilus assembly protein CpaB